MLETSADSYDCKMYVCTSMSFVLQDFAGCCQFDVFYASSCWRRWIQCSSRENCETLISRTIWKVEAIKTYSEAFVCVFMLCLYTLPFYYRHWWYQLQPLMSLCNWFQICLWVQSTNSNCNAHPLLQRLD